jgi:hypothetical protein
MAEETLEYEPTACCKCCACCNCEGPYSCVDFKKQPLNLRRVGGLGIFQMIFSIGCITAASVPMPSFSNYGGHSGWVSTHVSLGGASAGIPAACLMLFAAMIAIFAGFQKTSGLHKRNLLIATAVLESIFGLYELISVIVEFTTGRFCRLTPNSPNCWTPLNIANGIMSAIAFLFALLITIFASKSTQTEFTPKPTPLPMHFPPVVTQTGSVGYQSTVYPMAPQPAQGMAGVQVQPGLFYLTPEGQLRPVVQVLPGMNMATTPGAPNFVYPPQPSYPPNQLQYNAPPATPPQAMGNMKQEF